MKTKVRYILIILSLIALQCKQANSPGIESKAHTKIEQIRESGKLRVVTDYNSTSYFILRGQPLGYQYELLQELANFLEVNLEVVANNKLQEKFDLLENEEVDLIAVNLTVTKERKEFLDFTVPHTQTRQVLVQKKPTHWEKLSKSSMNDSLISNQLDLAGKTIHVQSKSTYLKRLQNLSDEIGDNINIIESKDGVEKLIEQVSSGKIEYTICDENVAMVNATYYDNIDISLPVSFPQNLAWAVKKGDDDLREVIDAWLTDFKKTNRYSLYYKKYFKNKRTSNIVESEYYAISSGAISPYDDYIKEYSNSIGWDWRLVASMMYQESRFNPEAKSWAGAYGLMQLMPNTAKKFGLSSSSPPKQHIRAGISFIKWLDKLYEEIEDDEERAKFVLASYNVGPGHVMDAQRLAEKNGKNPNIWLNNVDNYLLLKSERKYYSDPVVKYGYCRGTETFNYVTQVMERYNHYKNFVE